MKMFQSTVIVSLPRHPSNNAPLHFCGYCDPIQLFREAMQSLPDDTDTYEWELSWKQPYKLGDSVVIPQNLRLPDCTVTKIKLSCSRCKFTQQLWPPENSFYLKMLRIVNPHLPICYPKIIKYLINGKSNNLLINCILFPVRHLPCVNKLHTQNSRQNTPKYSFHRLNFHYWLEFKLSGSCDPEHTQILIQAEEALALQITEI